MASNIIQTISLKSGLCITLSDETRHYFGGYYHVRILARCNVPIVKDHFDNESEFLDARNKLGDSVRFERLLEKMAVPESDVVAVRDQLLEAFNNTTVDYLSSPDFERKFVRTEYRIFNGKPANMFAGRVFQA